MRGYKLQGQTLAVAFTPEEARQIAGSLWVNGICQALYVLLDECASACDGLPREFGADGEPVKQR